MDTVAWLETFFFLTGLLVGSGALLMTFFLEFALHIMYSFPVYINTSLAPEKPGKYLKTPFRRRRSIYSCFSGAGEVLIYTYLALEKPEKYLYTSLISVML